MGTLGLIGCSSKFRALPGGFDEGALNLFDHDIFSTSILEEIVGSSEAICRVTAAVGSHVCGRFWSGKQIGKLQSRFKKEAHISKITAERNAVATR